MHFEKKKKNHTGVITALLLVAAIAIGTVLFFVLNSRDATPPVSSAQSILSATGQSTPADTSATAPAENPNGYTAIPLPEEMRAMWVAYPDFQELDIATEAAMRATAGEMFDNCATLGLNTVIVIVRPFSDAFYESALFPWSHILTGTQGTDPGYDPLAVMVEEAHARGLRFEAYINPYRVGAVDPLAATNPAVQNPGWATSVDGALWYNPALPQVQQLITDGVVEILQNYDVDGIHFDDYFYPSFPSPDADTAFDADAYAQSGSALSLADWRRENVNQMVQQVYAAVKTANPTVSFGISTAGNNQYNYDTMYADVNTWMATPGYVDYVMPQLYWGFDYTGASGSTAPAFQNKVNEWAAYERLPQVRLYAGLAAYHIDDEDGGTNDQSEWASGHILADMVTTLRTSGSFSGFALFRYNFLYNKDLPHAPAEVAALTELLQ